jgi:hypothetical protein
MIKVAISAEPEVFKSNAILEVSHASKYPGASWMPLFKSLVHSYAEVVTSDVALKLVEEKIWDAKEIYIIQHVHDPEATLLVEKGAHPFLLTCLESPIYVGKFYDDAIRWMKIFKYKILPSGLFINNFDEDCIQLMFPCYFKSRSYKNSLPWSKRRFMVAVISNKYTFSFNDLKSFTLESLIWNAKRIILFFLGEKVFYSIKFKFNKIQLQEARLNLVTFFLKRKVLDLYGRGWDRLNGLPPPWQKEFIKLFQSGIPSGCDNKIQTISKYKFCLCIENASFPGYVTEKIIEAMVAGVVPVYLGAPNIQELIPRDCYIDIRDYSGPKALQDNLMNISEDHAGNIIAAGQIYLINNKAHTYEDFAQMVNKLFLKYLKESRVSL